MLPPLCICLASLLGLLALLRTDRVSLGLPFAYLYLLLLIHLPGAFAHLVGEELLHDSDLTAIGMRFTAVGSVCFVAGVWLARSRGRDQPVRLTAPRSAFFLFCLVCGWLFNYLVGPILHGIPSLGAVIDKGATVWMLGVMLGLRAAVSRRDLKWVAIWGCALLIYPAIMLVLGGFLSYGSMAAIVVLSALVISVRSYWQVVASIALSCFLGMSVFVGYFQHRSAIREQVWGGASTDSRIESVMNAYQDLTWFDPGNPKHLLALDARLNQNYFVGLAAQRIWDGQVDYLYGRSVTEGLLALVPRFLWPEKSVFAGSPKIVSEMTGLQLSEGTSYGVGQVMEFQINFGIPGVVLGFLLLGWSLGTLDRRAALAEARGDLGRAILFFLPAVALIQPNGSIVELTGGSAAALIGSYVWMWVWKTWGPRFYRFGKIGRRSSSSPRSTVRYRGFSPAKPGSTA